MNLFLSPTEEKIVKALKEAAALHSKDRGDPNNSVKVAALNHGLNAEMTDRLVEAFNITFIRSHIKTASDKESSIPLADKEKVFKMLFKDVPLPAQKVASVSDPLPRTGPMWVTEKTRKVAEKAVAQDQGYFAGPESIPRRICSVVDTDNRRRSDIRGRKEAALDGAIESGTRLAETFRSSYFRPNFKGFEFEAMSIHGESAIPILESVRKAAGLSNQESLKDLKSYSGKYVSESFHPREVKLVGEILEFTRKYAEAVGDETRMTAEMEDRGKAIDKFISSSRKSAAAPIAENMIRDMLTSEYRPNSVQGIQRDLMVATDLVDSPSNQAINEAHIENISKEFGDAATQRFRKDRGIENLKAEDVDDARAFAQSSVLSDLMANDDIISAANPNDVKEAYSTLVRLSPEAASNTSVARSIIRSTLAGDGALDPFTADQIVTLQEKVMKARGQLPPPT